jgi:hypothetical protein
MRFVDLCVVLVLVAVALWGASVALPQVREVIHELSTVYLWI